MVESMFHVTTVQPGNWSQQVPAAFAIWAALRS